MKAEKSDKIENTYARVLELYLVHLVKKKVILLTARID